jgi:hypothetical protein
MSICHRSTGVLTTVKRLLVVIATVPALCGWASTPTVLLSDNFNANTANTTDLNVDITRQTGTLAPITYTMANGPGHYGHQLQNPNALNQLLVADFANSTSSLNQNFNGANSAGGLVISFEVDGKPAVYDGGSDNWGCINLGAAQADQMVNVNGGQAHFGILFRAAGTIQAFDGGAVVSPSPEPAYTTSPGSFHHIELVITDADGNPFDGLGDTIIEVFSDYKPLPVWTYRKVGGYANNYINLQGSYRAHFDNLVISQLPADRTPVIVNHSFELNDFTVFPGYVDGNGPIIGWLSLGNHGVNPGSFGGPFTDNGTIPDGTKAAFLQGDGPMSQVVSGFSIGSTYQIRYYENARTGGTAPSAEVRVGGQTVLATHSVSPVGGSNPYRLATTDPFVATATAMELAFVKSNPQGGDTTLLIDNVTVLLPNTPPTISRHPESQLGGIGENVTFTVIASGSAPLSYQWYFGDNAIAGATTNSYTFLLEFPDQGGDYHVVVSNSAGSATSDSATLTVRASIPGLFNTGVDDNKQALTDGAFDPHYQLVVNADSGSVDAIVQNSAAFPIMGGPWVANTPGSKWIGPRFDTAGAAGLASGNGIYVYRTSFDLTGLDIGSVLITGSWAIDNNGVSIRVNGTPTGIVNNNGFTALTSFTISSANATFVDGVNTLEFEVQNVDAVAGYTGLYVSNLRGLAALAGTPPSITAQPQGVLAGTGENVSLSALASGSSPLTYQWYQDGAAVSGATAAMLALPNITHAQAGDYFLVVQNPAGSATSEVARVTVRDTVTTLFNTGVDDTRTVLLDGGIDPHYQIVVNPDSASPDATVHNSTIFPIVTGPWVANSSSSKWISPRFDTGAAAGGAGTAGNYTYRHTFSLDGLDPASVIVTGSWATDNEGLDILINGVSTGQRNTIQFPAYTSFVINSGFLAGLNTIDFQLNNAAVGFTGLRVENIRGLATALPPNTPPFIVAEPADATASVGDRITLSVRANGSAPLSYQWYFGADPLLDQTNASLNLFLEFPDLGGAYSVEVSNGAGSLRSREAIVTVLSIPIIISQPQSQVALLGESVSFTVQARGVEPFLYRWFHNGTEVANQLTPELTVIASPATAGEYLVEVSNDFGLVNSASVTLGIGQPLPMFNTGVDDAGAALADGATDPHYQITVNPDSASPNAIVQDSTVFPIVGGPWVANNDHSKWIGPRLETSGAAGGVGAAGNYLYRTTVDLTGYDHTAVLISGVWATDNDGLDILINGESTGQPNTAQFTVFTPFSISGGFRPGLNTIDFSVNNSGVGYTGLRVDQLRAIAVQLPNQPPSFVKGPDITVAENAGPQTFVGWATAISPGPPTEANQQVSFEVSNNNPSLFTAQPAISPDGTLTFTGAPNATGSASVTVVLRDSGGTAGGGMDHSAPQTFTITVLSPNQPPVAVAQIEPLADFSPTITDLIVISPNGSNAVVILDGSLSSDPDGDPLTYAWSIDGQAAGAAVEVLALLEVGAHEIRLVVTDPQGASGVAVLQVQVITAGEGIELLVALVDDADIARGNKRPFIATLKNAAAAFDDGRTIPALNMLRAFQNKLLAQLGRTDPDVAEIWIGIAQTIMDAHLQE